MLALERISKQKLLIALDRDGTLVPYAPTPQEAVMSAAVKSLLSDLAACPDVDLAIVSARSVEQLQEDIEHPKIILAGNYGLDILFGSAGRLVQPSAQKALPEINQLRTALTKLNADIPASFLEDQLYCLHLHYRNVSEEFLPYLHAEISKLEQHLSQVRLNYLPTSYEFFPRLPWDKGNALDTIQKHLGLSDGQFFPIVLGDSEGDEPGLAWANARNGLSMRVATKPVQTAAQKTVVDPEAAAEFLNELLALKSASKTAKQCDSKAP
jgi:trehalose 6-phosphate phosphatase